MLRAEINTRLSKWEIRNVLGYKTRKQFNQDLKILATDKDCPFTYEQIKVGHFVRGCWVQFILKNL